MRAKCFRLKNAKGMQLRSASLCGQLVATEDWSVYGHLGMDTSWSLPLAFTLHSLLIDDDDAGARRTLARLLEQNFTLLIGLRKYWTGVERSLSRLRSFHRACQLSRRLASGVSRYGPVDGPNF